MGVKARSNLNAIPLLFFSGTRFGTKYLIRRSWVGWLAVLTRREDALDVLIGSRGKVLALPHERPSVVLERQSLPTLSQTLAIVPAMYKAALGERGC